MRLESWCVLLTVLGGCSSLLGDGTTDPVSDLTPPAEASETTDPVPDLTPPAEATEPTPHPTDWPTNYPTPFPSQYPTANPTYRVSCFQAHKLIQIYTTN
jgi:hypothetical protein